MNLRAWSSTLISKRTFYRASPPPLPRTQEAHQRPALGPGEAFWRGFLNRPLSSAGEQEAGPDPTQLASAER